MEYNPRTNTWKNMPSLQEGRYRSHNVCTLNSKIFVLGGCRTTSCEMMDLSEDDPKWRYIANMDSSHMDGGAVVVDKKIYVLGGGTNSVELYNADQGISSIAVEYCNI